MKQKIVGSNPTVGAFWCPQGEKKTIDSCNLKNIRKEGHTYLKQVREVSAG